MLTHIVNICKHKRQMFNKLMSLMLLFCISSVFANNLQTKLMEIAAEEASIANIGANKYMMLYGTQNPIPVINRWIEIENRPLLTEAQLIQLNNLEAEKQRFLKQVAN